MLDVGNSSGVELVGLRDAVGEDVDRNSSLKTIAATHSSVRDQPQSHDDLAAGGTSST